MPATYTSHSDASDAHGSRTAPTVARAAELVERFVGWLDRFGDRSHDPYDFWATRIGGHAKALYYRRSLLGRIAASSFVAVDAVLPRARVFVRRPTRYAIADAHYARGFFYLARDGHHDSGVARGEGYLGALDRSRSPMFDDPAWGYPFDWPSRFGVFRAGWPLVTTIPYCYEAFEAGYAATADGRYLETMRAIAEFTSAHIPVTGMGEGVAASAYSPFDRRRVVNASAYRGYLLTSAAVRFQNEEWLTAGAENIAFVLSVQSPDGSWPYSIDDEDFIDNFHTCMILKNLAKVVRLTSDPDVRAALHSGYAFYVDRLLDSAGLPTPYARRPRVVLHRRELYDYAEGINLAHLLRAECRSAEDVLDTLVADLDARWQLPDGHFVTRELVVGRNTVPYHRWAQAQTFHALAHVAHEAG